MRCNCGTVPKPTKEIELVPPVGTWATGAGAGWLLVRARVTAPTTAAVMTPQEAAWRNQVALVASAIDDDRAMQIAETLVLPPLPVPPQVGEPSW